MNLSSSPLTPPARLLMKPGAAGIELIRRALVLVAVAASPLRLTKSDAVRTLSPLLSKVALSSRFPVIASSSITQPEPPYAHGELTSGTSDVKIARPPRKRASATTRSPESGRSTYQPRLSLRYVALTI